MFDQTSEADTLKRCREAITAARGVDEFTLRIFRRKSRADENRGGMFANLCQGTIDHIQMPELWMPDLLGPGHGGYFTIQVWHGSDSNTMLGQTYFERPGTEAEANAAALKSPGWVGPKQLLFPRPAPVTVDQGTRVEPSRYSSEAPSPTAVRAAAVLGDGTPQSQQFLSMVADVERQQRQLLADRAALDLKTAKDEAERRQTDLERRLQESNQRFEALSRKLDEIKATPTVVAPQRDMLDTMIRAKDLFMPLVAQYGEVRKMEVAAQRDQTAALLKQMNDTAAVSAANLEKVLTKISERESGPSIKPQMEALGSMASMAVSMMHTAQSMIPKTEEPSIAMVIAEKAMPVFEQFGKAMLENAEARKIEAQNGGTPRDVPASRIPPPPNRPVQTKPTPAPAQTAPPAATIDESTSIGALIAMVKREEPPEKIGAYFFDVAVTTPEMDAVMNRNGRDIGKTIAELALAHKSYLTSWWLKDPNRAEQYLESVEQAILSVGRARGHVNDDDETPEKAEKEAPTTTTPNGVPPIQLVDRDDSEAQA